jgi:Met-zincin/Domain of unknown function (DUF5117)
MPRVNPRLPNLHRIPLTAAAASAMALLLTACATTGPAPDAPARAAAPAAAPKPAEAGSAPSAAAPTATAAVRPAPQAGAPAPFAEVTRGARRSDGYLPLWTRDEKTWIEIPAALLDQPMFLGMSVAGGMGSGPFWPGMMLGREQIVVLRRVGNTVQLLARNQHARAPAGTPLARAVGESYSDSLLGAAPLAAAPQPGRGALLVDAAVLLGGDIAGTQTMLEVRFRLPYALDRANSSIDRARTQAAGLYLTMRAHFAVPKLPAPPAMAPGAPPPNPAAQPNPPGSVPDARSLFLATTYTLAPLPALPMKPRLADPRVGYFTSSFMNFGDDTQEGRRTHFIERWRLEKKDPAAALSEPKEPIRVVLDRNIPERWRKPLREAALEWNKAFERAGFRNAISVEQQPADADWTTLEGVRVLALRWFAQEGPGSTAVGPSQADPRTGEILRGAAIVDENRVRIFRARAAEAVPRWAEQLPPSAPSVPGSFAERHAACDYADVAFEEAGFGFDLLVERGLLDPNGPEAERYIEGALKNVTMHEIGHALGLRHNFRASAAVTPAQLRDRAWTQANGLSASVMEYNAQNLPLQGEPVADYNMLTLGAYDYWAIEYGYREYAGGEDEPAALKALAARSEREPTLAYSTDQDLGNSDPLVNQRDMSSDPLAFAQRQILLARELWQRVTTRPLAPDEDLTVYRRSLSRVLGSMGTSLPFAAKYVGGVYTSRATAGADRPLLVPVPAAQQRAALDLVVNELFSSASFRFDPRVMSRLGVDHHEPRNPAYPGVDFSLPGAVLGLQRGALDTLMSEGLAGRLADAESKVDDPRALLSYADVQDRLARAVWSELAGPGKGDIDSLRRNLQREHVRRLATGLVRPASATAAEVRGVYRQVSLRLQAQLKAALAARRGNALVQAHLEDSLATLTEALKAPLVKQGV